MLVAAKMKHVATDDDLQLLKILQNESECFVYTFSIFWDYFFLQS